MIWETTDRVAPSLLARIETAGMTAAVSAAEVGAAAEMVVETVVARKAGMGVDADARAAVAIGLTGIKVVVNAQIVETGVATATSAESRVSVVQFRRIARITCVITIQTLPNSTA